MEPNANTTTAAPSNPAADAATPADPLAPRPYVPPGGPVTVAQGLDPDEIRHAGSRGIPFNGVQITRNSEGMDPEHAGAVRWIYSHGRDRGWNLSTLAAKLRKPDGKFYDHNTLYKVFQGKYGGGLENVVTAIKTYRRLAEERELAGRPMFIETHLARQVWGVCDKAITYQRIALMFGDGQTGKTEALEEYARRNNHGRTRYVRLPHGARYSSSVRLMARACYLNHRGALTDLCESIMDSADAQTLFIVDELQQLILNPREEMRLMFVEFLRELFDRRKCGIVLCGTNEALVELETGPNAVWLRQIRRRALPIIRLPAEPADEDVIAFAGHFQLDPEMPATAVEVVRRISADHGVGQLITYFQATSHLAAAEKMRPTWMHFLRAVKALHGLGAIHGTSPAAANAGNGATVPVPVNGKGGR